MEIRVRFTSIIKSIIIHRIGHWALVIGDWGLVRNKNLTPNPFPAREGEQELKPLSDAERGLERG